MYARHTIMVYAEVLLNRFYTTQRFGAEFSDFLSHLTISEQLFYDPQFEMRPEIENACWSYLQEKTGIEDVGLLSSLEYRFEDLFRLNPNLINEHERLSSFIEALSQIISKVYGFSIQLQSKKFKSHWDLVFHQDDLSFEQHPLLYNSYLEYMCGINRFIGRYAHPFPRVEGVYFIHSEPTNTHSYRICWGNTPIYFDQDFYGIRYSSKVLDSQLYRSKINDFIRRHKEISDLSNRQEDIISQVWRSLSHYDSSEAITLADIAESLHISERAIQKKLKEKNTSFNELYSEIRMEQAKNYLQNNRLNISQVAQKMGYSDISAFSRAFKKNTGMSPNSYKKSKKEG